MNAKIKSAFINTVLMAVTIAAALVIGSQAPGLYQKWRGHDKAGDFSQHMANQPQRLTLYGTTTCPYCAKARAYLTRQGIPFNDRLVDQSKEAQVLYQTLKEEAVPILVSEKKLIVGYYESEYDKLASTSRKQ